MKKITLFILVLCFSFSAFAQKADQSIVDAAQKYQEKSDPKATAILDKVKLKYDAYESLQAQFNLTIQSGEDEFLQEGKLSVKGDKYKVEMDDNDVISDGKTVWFHQKLNKEVQINNPDPDDTNMISPANMLKIYEKDFVYALVGETREKNRNVYKIEFKPTNNFEEYSKLRVTIDKTTLQITRMKVFSKDGMRYIMEVKDLKSDVSLSDSFFSFDPESCTDCHIIDLRTE